MWRNTQSRYGLMTITLHWLVATGVTGLFALGMWMVELEYYDPWYRLGPDLHKGIGILLFGVMLAWLAWSYGNPRPGLSDSSLEQKAAVLVHRLLYLLLFALMLSGYLISTAEGRAIEVFSLFSLPATLSGLENQADIAGVVHRVLAYALIGLATLHALAALKHHFIDRDQTLKRMLTTR